MIFEHGSLTGKLLDCKSAGQSQIRRTKEYNEKIH